MLRNGSLSLLSSVPVLSLAVTDWIVAATSTATCHGLMQWICPPSEQSVSTDIPQLLKELTITSLVDSQASFTHWRQRILSGALVLPAAVKDFSPEAIYVL